ncbi:MAG: hydroxyacylglutathione hydrolase [Candidatus Puniceispirillaceae bacterium]
MAVICYQFPYHSDNYGFLLHDADTGQTAAIDAGCAESYQLALDKTGFTLTEIWITHHHWDHTDGLADLKAATGAKIVGPANTKEAIATYCDQMISDGEGFIFAGQPVKIIATPGHTLDMMNYYLPQEKMLFSGDSLFVLGCGRLFEGDGPMMWQSLEKLKALPDDTVIYSAHEYAAANAAFAITIDPDNTALQERIKQITELGEKGVPTVPSTLADENATNPFLRADDAVIRVHLGMQDASDAAVFTEIRHRKDRF